MNLFACTLISDQRMMLSVWMRAYNIYASYPARSLSSLQYNCAQNLGCNKTIARYKKHGLKKKLLNLDSLNKKLCAAQVV